MLVTFSFTRIAITVRRWFEVGPEPSDRVWSEALTADPWGWLAERLTGIEQTVADAGLDPAPARADAAAIRAAAGRIVATARDLGPEQPFTRDDDFRLTRDAALRVRMLVERVEDRSAVPWDHVRPWLDEADRG